MSIVNGGEELGKTNNGCLASIMTEMDYDIDRHVKKYRATNTLR